MKPAQPNLTHYATTEMFALPDMLSGIVRNIASYIMSIRQNFGITWKIGIVFVCIFFIIKSIHVSSRKKTLAFFVSILVICISFILAYGVYTFLILHVWIPRFFIGFGIFLAIMCIYVVSDYKKIAIVAVLALNWCLLVFSFSFGNALADQARYSEFRVGILLYDLNTLFFNQATESFSIQLENSIEYAPSIKNIAKHYPIIEELVPKRLGEGFFMDSQYYLAHFNYNQCKSVNGTPIDFRPLNLPVVLDSHYHTIKSDGSRILVILKH